ncbi:MAG: hypothetical protein JW800_05760 [Candidatus Omnitrophica bacterium]|nr:hypothetical protein [Candidatus Omnitrophota bacterium]
MKKNIELLISWLTDTGVINREGEISCSTNNGYYWRTGSYKYVYNEVTGYSVSAFVYLYKTFADESYLNLAKDAAAYLLNIQDREDSSGVNGAFFYGYRLPRKERIDLYYTFDNFIIINGLLDLHSVTGEPALLQAALICADWILKYMRYDGVPGGFYAKYDRGADTKIFRTADFAGDLGVLHGKIAVPFLKLWRIVGDDRYRKAAVDALDFCLTLQNEDGSFWANKRKVYVFSHAMCYAAEGLMYAYHALGEDRYRIAATAALNFLKGKLQPNGSLLHIYKDKNLLRGALFSVFPFSATDASSQYVRLALLCADSAKSAENIKLYDVDKVIKFLVSSQVMETKDPNLRGAVWHKISERWGIKRMSPVVSTWCSQFCLQAFIEYERSNKDQARFFIEHLY